jgi:hypothetical protein
LPVPESAYPVMTTSAIEAITTTTAHVGGSDERFAAGNAFSSSFSSSSSASLSQVKASRQPRSPARYFNRASFAWSAVNGRAGWPSRCPSSAVTS